MRHATRSNASNPTRLALSPTRNMRGPLYRGGRFQSSRPSAAAHRAASSTKAAQATAHWSSQNVPTSHGGESRCFRSTPQAVSHLCERGVAATAFGAFS